MKINKKRLNLQKKKSHLKMKVLRSMKRRNLLRFYKAEPQS